MSQEKLVGAAGFGGCIPGITGQFVVIGFKPQSPIKSSKLELVVVAGKIDAWVELQVCTNCPSV